MAATSAAALPLRSLAQDAPTLQPADAISPQKVISDDIERQKRTLLNPDPATSPDQREQAAERLLEYNRGDTIAILLAAMASTNGPVAVVQRDAVARAFAASSSPPEPRFVQPLRELLPTRVESATAALTRYATTPQADDAIAILLDFVRPDSRASVRAKESAIDALGAFARRSSAEALITLMNRESEEVRNHAADALINITGLRENGRNVGTWNTWWQFASRPDHVWTEAAPLAARAAELERKSDELSERVNGILQDAYQGTNEPSKKETMLLGWLRDAQPAIRRAAVNITVTQTQLGRQPTRDVAEQLRSMVADSSPEVRKNVAITLRDTADVQSIPAILAQLPRETEADVKIYLAQALGRFHDLNGVDALLRLLDDTNPRVQGAAADALKGEMAAVIRRSPGTLSTVTKKLGSMLSSNTLSPDLRGSLLGAAAPLGDPTLLSVFAQALDRNSPDTAEKVRIAGAQGLGKMTGRDEKEQATTMLIDAIRHDRSNAVRLTAVQQVESVGAFETVRTTLLDRMNPDAEKDPSVRAEAWRVFIALAKANNNVSGQLLIQLEPRATQGDHAKRIEMLELAVAKLTKDANGRLDVQRLIAQEQQNIGGEYSALKPPQWEKAAIRYSAALELWMSPNMNPAGMTVPSLSETLEKCYLHFDYPRAIKFAGRRIAEGGGDEEDAMGRAIVDEIAALTKDGKLKDADGLAAEALSDRMQPAFRQFWAQQIAQKRDSARLRQP